MTDRELMQQARSVVASRMCKDCDIHVCCWADGAYVINAIDARLAQLEPEPVAYDKSSLNAFVQDLFDEKMREGKHGHYETMFHVVHQAIKRVHANTKPFAWVHWIEDEGETFPQLTLVARTDRDTPLYIAAPRKEWQGLTDEERSYLAWESNNGKHCVAMTEAKLKEKNT